jgi:hypothetical protein
MIMLLWASHRDWCFVPSTFEWPGAGHFSFDHHTGHAQVLMGVSSWEATWDIDFWHVLV